MELKLDTLPFEVPKKMGNMWVMRGKPDPKNGKIYWQGSSRQDVLDYYKDRFLGIV